MSCTDCQSCTKSTTKLPDCWEGTATLATYPTFATLIATFRKGNGAAVEIEITAGAADEIQFAFSDLPAGWFSPGWYQVDFSSTNRSPATVTLSDTSTTDCITFEVIGAVSADNDDVVVSY
jgi:hypothetical protein